MEIILIQCIAESTHHGNIGETMEIPHQGKYNYYDCERPSAQRLCDIGTVMNNEEFMVIDSAQIAQNCMKQNEYKAILQSLKRNKKNSVDILCT